MLDPDMPTPELKLHMGEMTAQEVRTARAAIRWANSVHRNPKSNILPQEDEELIQFTVKCRKRWIPQLLGMFRTMQSLGSMGSSRLIGFYADGDGDFRPKFTMNGVPIWNPFKDGTEHGGYIDRVEEAPEGKKHGPVDYWFDAG